MPYLFLTTELSQIQDAKNSTEKLFLLTNDLQEASRCQYWLFHELKEFPANVL